MTPQVLLLRLQAGHLLRHRAWRHPGGRLDTSHLTPPRQIDCPAEKGCRIARKNGVEDPQWVRDCSLEREMDCEVYDNSPEEGGTTQSCNCGAPLCNLDWASAGSTTAGPGQDTTPVPGAASSPPSVAIPLVVCVLLSLLSN